MYGNIDKFYIKTKNILTTYLPDGQIVRKQICPSGHIEYIDANFMVTCDGGRLYIISTTTSSILCELEGEFESNKLRVLIHPDVICILYLKGRIILVSRSTWTVQRLLSFQVPNDATYVGMFGRSTLYIRSRQTVRLIKIYDPDLEVFHVFLVGALGCTSKILRADGDHSIKHRVGKWLV